MTDAPYWVSPREANLLITGKCNLRCRHCSVLSFGELAEDLSLEKWRLILDELARNRLIKLTLTGGEPFYRHDFADFLSEVASRPFRYSINSNGTLITDELVRLLKSNSAHLNELMISLDGSGEKAVDAQRGEGVFSEIVNGAGMLKEAGLPFGFYCTVTSLNVNELNETAALALKLGADWIKFNNLALAGPEIDPALAASIPEMAAAAERLVGDSSFPEDFIIGTITGMYKTTINCNENSSGNSGNRAFFCGGGKNRITVFPDGCVTPCDHLPGLILGNILENDLETILKSEKMEEFTAFVNQPKSNYEDCAGCSLSGHCTGGCPIEALIGSGSDPYRYSCLKKWKNALEE